MDRLRAEPLELRDQLAALFWSQLPERALVTIVEPRLRGRMSGRVQHPHAELVALPRLGWIRDVAASVRRGLSLFLRLHLQQLGTRVPDRGICGRHIGI